MARGITLLEKISQATLRKALAGDTPEARANAVQKLGRTLRHVELSPEERLFAEKILDRICSDVSELVRRALSVTLQNSPNLPARIARKLIADLDTIAAPILSNSPVLQDDDLIAVLKSRAAAKVKAVAQRERLSSHVTQAIVSFGDGPSVAKLAANDGAVISPQTAAHMAALYADDDLIREAALSRQDFPPPVVAKLIRHGARKVGAEIKSTALVTDRQAERIAVATRQRAETSLFAANWSERNIMAFVGELDVSGALTDRWIVRAAACGDLRVVTAALALRSGETVGKTKLMLFDSGPLGVRAVCRQANISRIYADTIDAAVRVQLELQNQASPVSHDRYRRQVIERLLTDGVPRSADIEADLLDLLDGVSLPRVVA